jgi:glycosyltransferase involved in cell wall biosynthesis
MRIVMLSSHHPPFDKRVFQKEARSLAAAGHEVTIICGSAEPIAERDGVRFKRFKPMTTRRDRLAALGRMAAVALRTEADAFHCNEPDSWVVGLVISALRRGTTKVVFDVHEHYPSQFATWFPERLRGPVEKVTALVLGLLGRMTDQLVLTRENLRAEFARADPERISTVMNCSSLSETRNAAELPAEDLAWIERGFTFVHIGLFNRYRGWPQMLEAMSLLEDTDVQFLSIGGFDDGSEGEFFAQIEKRGLGARVRHRDWVPYEEVSSYVRAARVGLVLFQPGEKFMVLGSPHKMFDYMLAGKPLLVPAFAPDIAGIVREHRCGFVVDVSRPELIAQACRIARDSPAELEEMGARALEAVRQRYNWEHEAAVLLDVYRRLAAERPCATGQA